MNSADEGVLAEDRENAPFDALRSRLGVDWPTLCGARQEAATHVANLRTLIAASRPPANTSVVAFGSLARGEWTTGSDVDWTLLIDGPSDMRHFDVTRVVEDTLREHRYSEPGPTGTFGSMASSHELVHYIGGLEDTNQNITRRILLLLESVSLSDSMTHDRVLRAILERYIVGDPPATTPGTYHVPLFLFNDIVRFWRTMTVDYATKKWQRSNKGWALRNIKLRMSRKLLFVKGMLMCFLCDRMFAGSSASRDPSIVEIELLNICRRLAGMSPVDLLSQTLLEFAADETARKTLGAYDEFLATLSDPEKRKALSALPFDQNDEGLFRDMRRLTAQFRDGISELFFDSHPGLAKLTKRYGVF